MGTDGVHLGRAIKRRKRGIQEETKGPQRTGRDLKAKVTAQAQVRQRSQDYLTWPPEAGLSEDCRRQKAMYGSGAEDMGGNGRQPATVW